MDPPPHGSTGKDFLQRYPAALLVVPTLSLLLGQALFSLHHLWIFLIVIPVLVYAGLQGWRRQRRLSLLILFSSVTFWIGFSMHAGLLRPDSPEQHLTQLTDGSKPLYVEGVFYREPERLPNRSRWYLRVGRIWRPLGAEETTSKVLVTVRASQQDWFYGDRVLFRVRVRPPRPAANQWDRLSGLFGPAGNLPDWIPRDRCFSGVASSRSRWTVVLVTDPAQCRRLSPRP